MDRRYQTRHYRLRIILFLPILFLPLIAAFHSALAQMAATPTLDEILLRLEGNLNHYDEQVPNFFCDEHVVSLIYGQKHRSTVTDSVFRVTRALSDLLPNRARLKQSTALRRTENSSAGR
jgi:hypothetical protein